MNFKQLSRSEINPSKWNALIERATYSHAYATTWFLDEVCPSGWEALVWGDYSAVMPLPMGKVLFFKQTFTPFWIQQLGLFKEPGYAINTEKLHGFLENEYYLLDLCVFDASDFKSEWMIQERGNYELSLEGNPKENYSKNLRRLIRRAGKNELYWEKSENASGLIQFFRKHKGTTISAYKDVDYDRLEKAIQKDILAGRGEIIIVKKGNKIVAMAFFQIVFGRATYLLGTSNEEGRQSGAMQFLMDVFITNWTGKLSVLDFEGSVIPGIIRFFKSFGASEKPYYRLKINRLPFPLNKMKA